MDEKVVQAARALLAQKQYSIAASMLRASVKRGGGLPFWALLGMAEHGLGRLHAAAEAFGKAIDGDPQGAIDARVARATVRFALSDFKGCEDDLARALEASPNHVHALCNLAILRERQGDLAAARALYDRALAVDESAFTARLNRAALLLEAEDAFGALADLDRLVSSPACTAGVHTGRARALFALHRDADALEAAQAALQLEPGNARALLDRGLALASLGRLAEGDEILRRVKSPDSSEPLSALGVWINRMVMRQTVCAWDDRDLAVQTIERTLEDSPDTPAISEPGLVFSMIGLPLSASLQYKLGNAALRTTVEKGSRIGQTTPPLVQTPRHSRIRVGLFAASLRLHPESFLVRRLLSDRDTARFEYYLYALNPDDGSALRAEISCSADRFVDMSAWSPEAIVATARRDELDLAVDLSGTYLHCRPEVFAARVAPVQAAFIATPSTLGPALHDYRLSDPWTTPPEEQAHWWERLVLLPPPPWVFDNRLAPAASGTRADHQLPERGFVFCCMSQAFKLDPDAFDVWMRLLHKVPQSVLWLLEPGALAKDNLIREAGKRGIPRDRLVFAPRVLLPEHLGRLAHADLFLDTFHCSAHTTALDALWAGLPVLTLTGRTMASRLATTFVRGSGLGELAVPTMEQYEARALEMARDRSALRGLKARLVESRETAPLFDTRARVLGVERAFVTMVERHRAGFAPEMLIIE